MSGGGELLRWTLGHILPLAGLATVMLGLLVAMSGSAGWARRIAGGPQAGLEEPAGSPERHVAIMMAMLRGFSVTVGALWLVEAGFAVVAGVNLLAGALGSGGGAGDLAGGAAAIAVGWLSGFVGRKLVRWHPERSG